MQRLICQASVARKVFLAQSLSMSMKASRTTSGIHGAPKVRPLFSITLFFIFIVFSILFFLVFLPRTGVAITCVVLVEKFAASVAELDATDAVHMIAAVSALNHGHARRALFPFLLRPKRAKSSHVFVFLWANSFIGIPDTLLVLVHESAASLARDPLTLEAHTNLVIIEVVVVWQICRTVRVGTIQRSIRSELGLNLLVPVHDGALEYASPHGDPEWLATAFGWKRSHISAACLESLVQTGWAISTSTTNVEQFVQSEVVHTSGAGKSRTVRRSGHTTPVQGTLHLRMLSGSKIRVIHARNWRRSC
jgi:hypothetical protein